MTMDFAVMPGFIVCPALKSPPRTSLLLLCWYEFPATTARFPRAGCDSAKLKTKRAAPRSDPAARIPPLPSVSVWSDPMPAPAQPAASRLEKRRGESLPDTETGSHSAKCAPQTDGTQSAFVPHRPGPAPETLTPPPAQCR